MMNDQQIMDAIRREVQAQNSASRFQLNPVQQHTHSGGADGPPVFQPTVTYAGWVPYDITATQLLGLILPAGWTLRYDGTGQYTVIHNLGTLLYTVTAACTQSTNVVAVPVVSFFANEVSIYWFDATSGAVLGDPVDTSFGFQLVQVNNKKTTPQGYDVVGYK